MTYFITHNSLIVEREREWERVRECYFISCRWPTTIRDDTPIWDNPCLFTRVCLNAKENILSLLKHPLILDVWKITSSPIKRVEIKPQIRTIGKKWHFHPERIPIKGTGNSYDISCKLKFATYVNSLCTGISKGYFLDEFFSVQCCGSHSAWWSNLQKINIHHKITKPRNSNIDKEIPEQSQIYIFKWIFFHHVMAQKSNFLHAAHCK